MADDTIKIKDSKNYNAGINDAIYDNVKIVDVSTGEQINPETFQDTIRLARNATSVADDPSSNNIVVHKEIIPTELLSQFITNNGNTLHSKNAINSLGAYMTEYMRDRVTVLDSANSKLDAVEDKSVMNNLTFRNYIDAAAGVFNNGKYEDVDELDDDKNIRKTPNLGIGLGESYVLNPTFQFNKRDDPRTNPMYTKIGRVYSTQLMNNWPIALIQPGRLKYHTSFMKLLGLGSGAGAQEALIRTGGDGIKGAFAKMLATTSDAFSVVGTMGSAIFGGSKVVEFKQSYNLFKQYSRYLYLTLAGMMGLISGNRYLGSVKNLNINSFLPNNNWSGGRESYLDDQYLPFRCGKGVTSSECFSNSMTSNPLMDTMNSTAEENDEAAGASAKDAMTGSVASFAKRMATHVAGSFSEGASVMSGRGRITLPDVFSSSNFSRSFSFSFKFHNPYGDNLSIFENEYLQFLTLLSIAAPRQTGKLSYTSPFAIRISVKNRIMINFGMVESLSVTRGGDSNDWTPSGYPKTLTVELSIKDMEPNITLPLASRGPLRSALEVMFPASGISEYLASLGGLSFRDFAFISKNKISRAGQMYASSWNAKLDRDNMLSTLINASSIQNITNVFAATDLDNYNKLGDNNRVKISDSFDNMIQSKYTSPGFLMNTVALNGQGGMTSYDTAKTAEKADIASIEGEMSKTVYPNV